MKLTNHIHVVGGGRFGFGISGELDCHVYVIDGGSELALVDPGLGMPGDLDKVLANMADDGLDPKRVRKLILTHYHADHIGAAREFQDRFDVEVYAAQAGAEAIRTGDEQAVSLDVAKAAGFYPADYRLPPCPVHVELVEGDTVSIGDLTLQTWETPGHSAAHLSFWFAGSDRTYLLGADLVFWGGKILLQNIHDCSIDAYAKSVRKIAQLDFDALLPGHLQISLGNGKAHVDQAHAAFQQLGVPPNLM
jgi:glyoxylase-like metal-dependent hydrolase (beta-lactamase superfamily II)